jgi:hypothetical protein
MRDIKQVHDYLYVLENLGIQFPHLQVVKILGWSNVSSILSHSSSFREAGVLGRARARNVYNTVVSNCLLWVGLIVCQSKGNIAVAM